MMIPSIQKPYSQLPTFSSYKTVLYRPVVLYRLAESYLNYAEALNEYDPEIKRLHNSLSDYKTIKRVFTTAHSCLYWLTLAFHL
jgi:hypothetical protein